MNTIQVGQKLYSEKVDRSDTFLGVSEHVVTKVANKYFYVDNDVKKGFDKETLHYRDKQYIQNNIQLFTSEEEIMDRLTALPLIKKLNNYIGGVYSRHSVKYTTEQMKQVLQILNIEHE